MKTLNFICVFASVLFLVDSKTFFCYVTYPNRPKLCPLIYSPVCANYPLVCETPPCPQRVKNFANGCEACADSLVLAYTDGPCPGDDTEGGLGEGEVGENGENGEGEFNEEGYLDGRTFCENSPEGVGVACPAISNPVCGYVNGQDFGTTYRTNCEACGQARVDYYVSGLCPGAERLLEALSNDDLNIEN